MEHSEGMRIARERIAEEGRKKTGSLNLSRLGLVELPEELFALRHLRSLSIAGSDLTNLSPLVGLKNLVSLDCSET
jgi:Leucine-rich repeat (LRR) protein